MKKPKIIDKSVRDTKNKPKKNEDLKITGQMLIEKLGLEPLPGEGGYFKRVYESNDFDK